MAKLVWDATGERQYQTGVNHGVLYPQSAGAYPKGVVWNGLTGVTESPDGAEPTDLWADNIKYASMRSAETFGGTIEAYMYPDEFMACNGEAELVNGVTVGQQSRTSFGLCYRTEVGDDTTPAGDTNYKLHLVYGCTASPSERAYETINDSPDAITFSWEFDTTPVNVTDHKPTSLIVIDSQKAGEAAMKAIEAILYGTDAVAADVEHNIEAQEATVARLPLPDEVLYIIEHAAD
jgi:hypothetical protein